MQIIVLTGGELRHRFFANSLAQKFDVIKVFSEEKALRAGGKPVMTKDEEALWDWHFNLAKIEEQKSFGKEQSFISSVRKVSHGEINSDAVVTEIAACHPEAIAVFGSSILKKPTIDICPGKIINMHLGLSPYYRGTATNFWPLHNGEPEYVGVTIHLLDAGIDTGAIAHQGRPAIVKGDNQHSIGNKAICAGVELMIQALKELEAGKLIVHSQKAKGRLYQRKDFSPESIRVLKERLDNGMIERYLEEKEKLGTIPYIA